MQKRLLLGALAAVLLLFASVARADVTSFDLTTGNTDISGFTGPYATVTITLTSATTADVTFTSLTNAGNIYLMGDGSSADVNVNAASWTITSISGSNAGTGFGASSISDGGSLNVSTFGTFNQTTDSHDGFTESSDTISFTLTNTSGGTWASAVNVLTPNADGNVAAAHIFVTSSPADASNGASITGFASGTGGAPPVPEPASMLLMGSGLVAFGGLLRRRKKLI